MKLNLIDELVLLALDDQKGTFIGDSLSFTYALGGAVLLELTLQDKISIENKKVQVKEIRFMKDSFLNEFLQKIATSKKERSLRYWIEVFGNKQRSIIKSTTTKLTNNGILTEKEEKFLWVFPNNKFPTKNAQPEIHLRQRLLAILKKDQEPTLNDIMLISLVNTCKLNREVFGKENAKLYKTQLKEIISNTKNSIEISETVREIHDTIIAVMVVLMTTTIITTS